MSEQEIQAPGEGVRVRYVRVTNLGEVMFMDRHDGIPLRIQPGESKNVPTDAAAHIFGWHVGVEPDQMFRHIQRRQGWNTPKYLEIVPEAGGKNLAEIQFAKLKIEPVMYKLVEVERDPSAPIAADPVVPDEPPRAPRRVDVRA